MIEYLPHLFGIVVILLCHRIDLDRVKSSFRQEVEDSWQESEKDMMRRGYELKYRKEDDSLYWTSR